MTRHAGDRIILHPGFVLHRKPYRETSLLLEVLTPEHGRLGLVARGARSPKSAFQGILQPFQPLLLSWTIRGELGSLTAAELDGRPWYLRGGALISAFYLNELVLRLVQRHDSHDGLYEAYARALAALTQGHGQEWALRLFEKALLQELGYGLSFSHEAGGGTRIQEDRLYCYHLELGPEDCAGQCGEGGIKISGRSLLALERSEIPDDAALNEIKRLMRSALALYLGGRPLASRELYRRMNMSPDGPRGNEP